MEVKLIRYTKDPERVCAAAARSTISKKSMDKLMRELDDEQVRRIIRNVLKWGHLSVIEHASFTFSISGISRVCSHQLVRHRIASYSQQSQRMVKVGEKSFVMPPSIKKNPHAKEIFREAIRKAVSSYQMMIRLGIPLEDARFILPQAVKTNIVVTMNARELHHFFNLRCCMKSQWEIRELANKMLSLVKKVAPTLFENAGPMCKAHGYCPENDRSCPLYKKYIGERRSRK
ncbi:FAD-dependent thymidylate synthase [archaeon]|nr:MAG: FAD-dependent thymidylate synthase [archaeon]RLG65401.1 MAG: FAD-dependent thymidylate synthase [archaeon]HDM23451.1 FAD-dependent thymidylate synthase [Candidatus Bathyarchaeota archaeon]